MDRINATNLYRAIVSVSKPTTVWFNIERFARVGWKLLGQEEITVLF